MKYKLDFETDYHQFYLTSDNASELNTDDREEFQAGYIDKLILSKNSLTIITESYKQVTGEIELLDSSNNKFNESLYDHIVEAGINISSGILKVLDCPFSQTELEIQLNPANYRVRVYFTNMIGNSSNKEKENDVIKIEIWPDSSVQRRVLKRFIEK